MFAFPAVSLAEDAAEERFSGALDFPVRDKNKCSTCRLIDWTLWMKMFSGFLSGDPEKKAVPVASLAEDAAEERFSGALDFPGLDKNKCSTCRPVNWTLRRKRFSRFPSGDPEKKKVPVAFLAADVAEE